MYKFGCGEAVAACSSAQLPIAMRDAQRWGKGQMLSVIDEKAELELGYEFLDA